MEFKSVRNGLDKYIKDRYGIDPEILPFSHENYEICRHTASVKWFAVFIVKDRSAFGLEGNGSTEIVCLKPRDPELTDLITRKPGYLKGYPSVRWNWISVVLDGSVPLDEICRLVDGSYDATRSKGRNGFMPLPKREIVKQEE